MLLMFVYTFSADIDNPENYLKINRYAGGLKIRYKY